MKNAAGYFGQPSVSPNVLPPPFQSLVPQQIQLTQAEIAQALAEFGLPPWRQLSVAQQKMVAAYILENREDPVSNAQAQQVIDGNPAFQTFQVVFSLATAF